MKVKNFKSQCSPELNARILRGVENLVCRYRKNLPDGWRCCIEFQRENDYEPYYLLDVQSNQGGGDFAPVKMQMLKLYKEVCPRICGTGQINPVIIRSMLQGMDLNDDTEAYGLAKSLADRAEVDEITDVEWKILKDLGITHWYGGIRIPYDILVTEMAERLLVGESAEQFVDETKGEIRIAFSGAKEWQDTFFCFCIFERIQVILNSLWGQDQIWYNLRGLKEDPNLQFWMEALSINEAPED